MQHCTDIHIGLYYILPRFLPPYHAKACLSVQRQLNRRLGILEMHLILASNLSFQMIFCMYQIHPHVHNFVTQCINFNPMQLNFVNI